ncbi:hypothetical protein AKJ37_07415 [candidate division MSBL1 archaeon SCGC-AAA259I09]|uniref:CobQ/CobB/MinD/ParA nucleotide binding domain-containing protein n=1 Tax=candidate division MSBL1 archaeon SCGC-AAA259I09 TaxID=1698267 RepID=A0A133UKA9_9EURY|nr:hypothetical protein AKJ37_07415 [candidate division MSBL1 archaeon SCGC-AAA259I09]
MSALLAKEMAKRGKRVLVVDNDESNFGLHSHLGLNLPKDFMYFFGGKENLFERSEEIRDGMRTKDLPDEYISSDGDLNLLAIGKISEYGEGCACPMNALSGEFLKRISLEDDEILIVDMDAGIEHFGRKVEEGADIILVIVDPTRESVKLSQKIANFGEKIGKDVFFVLNRVNEETERMLSENIDNTRTIGVIPDDDRIFKAGLKGERLEFELDGVQELADFLMKNWRNSRE